MGVKVKVMGTTTEKQSLRWTVFGMVVASQLFILTAIYLIFRITDGRWSDWQLPVILSIVFLTTVIIGAMFTAIPEIKDGIKSEMEKKNEKQD